MTALFRRIQPSRFLITVQQIAQFLGIQRSQIVRVECWAYVLFVHRQGRGGQFISYRRLTAWIDAIAQLIQACTTLAQLDDIGVLLYRELKRFNYDELQRRYLRQTWSQHRDRLLSAVQLDRQPVLL